MQGQKNVCGIASQFFTVSFKFRLTKASASKVVETEVGGQAAGETPDLCRDHLRAEVEVRRNLKQTIKKMTSLYQRRVLSPNTFWFIECLESTR